MKDAKIITFTLLKKDMRHFDALVFGIQKINDAPATDSNPIGKVNTANLFYARNCKWILLEKLKYHAAPITNNVWKLFVLSLGSFPKNELIHTPLPLAVIPMLHGLP